MTKHQIHEIGFWLLVAGIAVHAFGNGKRVYDASKSGSILSSTEMLYVAATGALIAGAALLWKSIK